MMARPKDDPNYGLADRVVSPVTRKLYDLMKEQAKNGGSLDPQMMTVQDDTDEFVYHDKENGQLCSFDIPRAFNSDDRAQHVAVSVILTEIDNSRNGGCRMTMPGTFGVVHLYPPESGEQCNCDQRPDDAADQPDMWCAGCGRWCVGRVA